MRMISPRIIIGDILFSPEKKLGLELKLKDNPMETKIQSIPTDPTKTEPPPIPAHLVKGQPPTVYPVRSGGYAIFADEKEGRKQVSYIGADLPLESYLPPGVKISRDMLDL